MPEIRNSTSTGGKTVAILGAIIALLPLINILQPATLAGISQVICIVVGICLVLAGFVLSWLGNAIVKAKPDIAYIRTGMGATSPSPEEVNNKTVFINGWFFFFPAFHNKTEISLKTFKISVEKRDADSFLTQDKIRADIGVDFYIRVGKTPADIINAASTIGQDKISAQGLLEFASPQLIGALRTVVASKNLEQLHLDRAGFEGEILANAQAGLTKNGLILEKSSLYYLQQTDYSRLPNQNNVFDAQGAKTVAEITQRARVEKNEIEKRAEITFETENLTNLERLNEINVKKAESSALADRDQRNKRAQAAAEASAFAAEQDRIAQEATIAAEQAVQIRKEASERETEAARLERERTVEALQIDKDKAIREAKIAQEKAVETANVEKTQVVAVKEAEANRAKQVAEQEAQIAIAQKAEEKALADKARNEALALTKAAEESIATAQAKARADREKEVAVINEQAEAEKNRVKQQNQADVEAYKKERLAKADKEAALNAAEAVETKAKADANAAKMQAEGETAVAMVPVNVAMKQVEVDAAAVEVLTKKLATEDAHIAVSVSREVTIKQLEISGDVGKAFAAALGQLGQKMDFQVFGDPNTLATVMAGFMEGASKSALFTGLQTPVLPGAIKPSPMSNEAKALISDYLGGVKTAFQIQGAADNVSDEVKGLVSKFAESSGGGNMVGLLALAKLANPQATNVDAEKLQDLYKELQG